MSIGMDRWWCKIRPQIQYIVWHRLVALSVSHVSMIGATVQVVFCMNQVIEAIAACQFAKKCRDPQSMDIPDSSRLSDSHRKTGLLQLYFFKTFVDTKFSCFHWIPGLFRGELDNPKFCDLDSIRNLF